MPTLSSSTTLTLPAGQAYVFLPGSGVGTAIADPGGRSAKYSIGPQQTAIGPFSTSVSVDVLITSGSIEYRVDTDGDLRDQDPAIAAQAAAIAAVEGRALQIDPSEGLQMGGAGLSASQAQAARIGIGLSKLASTIYPARFYGPDASPTNPGVTITGGLYGSPLSNSLALSTSTSKFLYGGGSYVSNGNGDELPLKSASVVSGNIGVSGALSVTNFIEFYTTAGAIRLKVYVGGGSSQYASIRVRLDGKYVSRNSMRILTLASQPAGTVCAINLDFSAHGGSGIRRHIRVEYDNGVNMSTLSYDTGYVMAPVSSAPRVCFFGDSYFASGYGPSAGVNMLDNVGHRIASKLGWNATCSAVGGTGFVNNGGVNFAFNHPNRLADMGLQPFDGFVIAGGTNDGAGTAPAITASALNVLEKARSVTDGEIIVFGCWNALTSSTLPMAQIENAISEAVQEFGDAKTYFIPVTTDPNGSWINSGNAALYIAADGTHAAPGIGEEYFAERAAAAIQQRLVV